MSKPFIWVFLGLSGAGKDSAYDVIAGKRHDPPNLKFSLKAKQFLEGAYDLPDGALSDREARLGPVPDLNGDTYLDVLGRAMDHFDAIDPYLFVRPLVAQAVEVLQSGWDVVFTDLRKPAEARKVLTLAEYGDLRVFEVIRPGVRPLEADRYLFTNKRLFISAGYPVDIIVNDGSLEEYQKVISYYVNSFTSSIAA